jgi:N-acetyl-anhydromuramyl-L-alanine amidase AmpD
VDENGGAKDNFTTEQLKSLTAIVATLERAYPGAEVLGHRDLSPDLNGDGVIEKHEWVKDCPCFDVRKWRNLT